MKIGHCLNVVAYADNTFLPFRRRFFKILRPFFVLIRLRNP